MGSLQNVAGWWGHQPGRPAVGGVHRPLSSSKRTKKEGFHSSFFQNSFFPKNISLIENIINVQSTFYFLPRVNFELFDKGPGFFLCYQRIFGENKKWHYVS